VELGKVLYWDRFLSRNKAKLSPGLFNSKESSLSLLATVGSVCEGHPRGIELSELEHSGEDWRPTEAYLESMRGRRM
jgi:hypothetical protein